MSSKRLSPTARILQTSRLFSLPPPLPRPGSDSNLSSSTSYGSDTATTPYPTHAAITTPKSSLSRGDWGLKRPLPSRSTARTSTPSVRVSAVDTEDHVTDFEPASDHAMTLRKWQQFNIPVSRMTGQRGGGGGGSRGTNIRAPSGFEGNFDSTDPETLQASSDGLRWKYQGPWLAGKSEGEFAMYMRSQIQGRKREFREYVRHDAAKRKAADRRREAVENGDVPPPEETTNFASSISNKELNASLVALRKDPSRLNDLIQSFLDLPAQPAMQASDDYGTSRPLNRSKVGASETEPYSTHPSAGLSYLRTNSHIANHPVLGPQERHRPVEARVLLPPYSVDGKRTYGKLGVGGIVTEGQFSNAVRLEKPVPGVTVFDHRVEGGGKMWVHPFHAEVDAGGRIKLSVDKASENVVKIHQADSHSTPQGGELGQEAGEGRQRGSPGSVGYSGVRMSDAALEQLYAQAHDTLKAQT